MLPKEKHGFDKETETKMKQYTKSDLRALGEGVHSVYMKLSYPNYKKGSDDIVYEGMGVIHITTRKQALRKMKVGDIVTLNVDAQGVPHWAEYGDSGIFDDGCCNSEEYNAVFYQP